ncbi:MAG: hypothetical protein N2B03_05480, partial [Boseongicola sp.]
SRLALAKPVFEALDARSGPGRLMDIELLAQAGTLLVGAGAGVGDLAGQLSATRKSLELNAADYDTLQNSAELFWRVHAASRLIAGGPLTADAAGAGASAFLLRETGAGSVEALASRVANAADAVAEIIDRITGDAKGSVGNLGEQGDPV